MSFFTMLFDDNNIVCNIRLYSVSPMSPIMVDAHEKEQIFIKVYSQIFTLNSRFFDT